jgi:(1->4)-alpha-D-glucan 1-alpha-D-glucosylmutase
MTTPTATYRLQFRNGMNFDRAAALAGYLSRLGISHLYASPLFTAVLGSTHGYDGCDFESIEPEIGGERGFQSLRQALDSAALELIVDFVPNHMAAADANHWWQAVLEWGAASPYAGFFDIDWSAPKLMLPILGSRYEDELQRGTFGLQFDAISGALLFSCYERLLPLTPPSYALVLDAAPSTLLTRLGTNFASATVNETGALKKQLAKLASQSEQGNALSEAISAVASDRERLHQVHEAQIWQLADWRLAREAITYRRFFEISDLICLKVETPAVFEAVHRRLFALIAQGAVDGVRIDHIDGLADPKSYLERFQTSAAGTCAHYLLVEKIVEHGERVRDDWPIAGTTGYEFISLLAGLFVEPGNEAAMRNTYQRFTGTEVDYEADARDAKRAIFEYNLAAELAALTNTAAAIAAADSDGHDISTDAVRRAIIELATALPVYRTYINSGGIDSSGVSEIDRRLIRDAAASGNSVPGTDAAAVDFIAGLLMLDVRNAQNRDLALRFVTRFQQTSGPLMAKAIEDTLFYRFNQLIALNEVGGAPDQFGAPVSVFHAAMHERRRFQPDGLSATSTHDTKRGEDARARLYVLSEMPQTWEQAVLRWSQMNAPHRVHLADGPAPGPDVEWLFYQALAGVWPADLLPQDEDALFSLQERMCVYMEKALREAKLRTNWFSINEDYEQAVRSFVVAVLTPGSNKRFIDDFAGTCAPVWLTGAINSLAQLAIKITAPGVPDFYQGSELWNFSLVDPDNRSAVDFAYLERLLGSLTGQEPESLLDQWKSGLPKLAFTIAGLRARNERRALFAEGQYVELASSGEHAGSLVAFAREQDDDFAIVVAPRLVLGLTQGLDRPLIPAERWGDTAIAIPNSLQKHAIRDAMTGAQHAGGASLLAAQVLARFPVALLVKAPS